MSNYNFPDDSGKFGQYGGRFVAETLMPAVLELDNTYKKIKTDPSFWAEFDDLMKNYVGRPSPLYFAKKTTEYAANGNNGAKISNEMN